MRCFPSITKPEIKAGVHTTTIVGSAGGLTRNAEYRLIVIDPSNPSALTGNVGSAALPPQVPSPPVTGVAGPPSSAGAAGIPRGYVFSRSLYRGVSGEDVRKLQSYLASDPALYPEGLVTGYFGALTEAAVGRFQIGAGVLSSKSDDGYGIFGPRTRAKLNSLLAL